MGTQLGLMRLVMGCCFSRETGGRRRLVCEGLRAHLVREIPTWDPSGNSQGRESEKGRVDSCGMVDQ